MIAAARFDTAMSACYNFGAQPPDALQDQARKSLTRVHGAQPNRMQDKKPPSASAPSKTRRAEGGKTAVQVLERMVSLLDGLAQLGDQVAAELDLVQRGGAEEDLAQALVLAVAKEEAAFGDKDVAGGDLEIGRAHV